MLETLVVFTVAIGPITLGLVLFFIIRYRCYILTPMIGILLTVPLLDIRNPISLRLLAPMIKNAAEDFGRFLIWEEVLRLVPALLFSGLVIYQCWLVLVALRNGNAKPALTQDEGDFH